jgi:type I restriction enzyme S subunit
MLTADWSEVDLEQVATLQRGYDLPSKVRKPGSVPVVTSTGVTDTHAEAREHGPGVVTGRYGTIGEVFFINEDFWPHNTTLFVKDFHRNDPLFVAYLLRTIDFQSSSGKTGVPGVNRNDLHALKVKIPPTVDEQRAVAGALSDVDALIEALDQLVAKKRDVKQATMQLLLTGKQRLPGFHGEWKVRQLADVIDFANGKPHEGHIDQMGRYDLITLDSIGIDGKLKAEHRPIGLWDNSLAKDDIVIILSDLAYGNLLGLCDVIPEDNRYVLNQRVGRLRVKLEAKANPQFLRLQINRHQDHFKKRGQGTSQRHIYRRDIDQLEIELPEPDEQTAIAEVLSDMDAELAALEQRRDKTRALKQGMMQELLTGRTRLVDKPRSHE